MAKLRKVVFFDESFDFLGDLIRGGRLVNVIMKQVFTGTRAENLQLALDLIHGKKRLDVTVVDSTGGTDKKQGEYTSSRIQVRVRQDQAKKEKPNTGESAAKKGLLDDLSRMAREFGE